MAILNCNNISEYYNCNLLYFLVKKTPNILYTIYFNLYILVTVLYEPSGEVYYLLIYLFRHK